MTFSVPSPSSRPLLDFAGSVTRQTHTCRYPAKRGRFDENCENDEFAFYPLKTRASLLRPLKTTKMTKMAGVTQAKAWFRKSRVCSSLKFLRAPERVRFQALSSVSFLALTELRGENSLSSSQPMIVCQSKLTEFFPELTEFAPKLSEAQ